MDRGQIAQVRRFNRVVTSHVGALENSYLQRGRPLSEARLLHEVGPNGIDVRALRERLKLNSGYLSRLLRSLERQGLVQPSYDEESMRRSYLLGTGGVAPSRVEAEVEASRQFAKILLKAPS